MFSLKHVVVFFILENTVSPSCFNEENCYVQDYLGSSSAITSDVSTDYKGDGDESPENNFTQFPNYLNEDLENNSTETPENSSTETPEDSSIETSENSSTETPENSSIKTSENSSTETPENSSTETPENSSTETPEDSSTETSENSSTETPENSSTETPEDSSTETPVDSSIETSENSSTETPENSSTETPENSSTETPENSSTETPENSSTETPENISTETPVDSSIETSENSSTETSENSSTETPENSSTETPEDSSTETPVDSSIETSKNNSTETPENSSTETPENSSTETPENSSTETPENSSTETPENSSTETPEDSSTETPVDSSIETSENSSTETPENSSTETPENSSTETPENSSTETPENSSTETPENISTETPVDSSIETSENSSTETSENSSTETPENSSTETPEDSSTETPVDSSIETSKNNSTETPENSSTETPENSSTETPENSSTETPENSSTETPENSSTETPEDSSTETPVVSSIETSENSSTETPENSSTETPENSSTETPENSSTETSKKNLTGFCPEDHSIISHSDINYLIEENGEILKIKQHFEHSSYPDAEELIQKFEGELEIFLERFIDRPDHMHHILRDMAGLRQKLEPDVKEIVSQLELFHSLKDDMNRVVDDSDNKIMLLERYKNLCQINCEEIDIRNRFGQNYNNYPLGVQSAGLYCIRLEDLNNIINEKLSEVQAQHNNSLYVQLEVTEKMYAQKMTEFQTNLKKTAVKLFGMTMYDILSLEDDYHHFAKHLEQVNISSETHNIRKNTADIALRLIELELALQKYRQYCLKCFINQRIKHNIIELLDGSTLNNAKDDILEDKIAEVETVVIELIKVKIDAIRESIKSNLTAMFEELDRKLNDSEVIDEYVMRLRPIQDEIEKDVKSEQDALLELKSRIPAASLDKILDFSKKSKQTIQDLESAKQFIDQFISRD